MKTSNWVTFNCCVLKFPLGVWSQNSKYIIDPLN